MTVLSTLATPLGAAFSRRQEHAADAFGLAAIEGLVPDARQSAAHAFQRLGEIDLAEPDPGPLTVSGFMTTRPSAIACASCSVTER